MLKTFALVDLIGVRERIERDRDPKILKKYWDALGAWAGDYKEMLKVRGKKIVEAAEVQVMSASDTAFLNTKREYIIDDFYKIVYDLKECIERQVGKIYCIVNHDKYIEHPTPTQYVMGVNSIIPSYTNIAGSGPAWENLLIADSELKNKREWHKIYYLYCVGRNSKPDFLGEEGEEKVHPFKDRNGKMHDLIALK